MGKKQISSKTYQKAKKLSRIFGYISIALTIVGIFFPPALALGALFGAVAGSLQIVQGEYEKQRNIPGGTTDMVMGGIGVGLSALDLGGTLGVAKGASRIADGADKVDYITRNMRTLGYISMGINVGLVVGDEAYGAYEYITGDNKALGKSLMIQGGIQVGTMIGGAGLGYAIERSGLVSKFNMFIGLTTEEPTITTKGYLPTLPNTSNTSTVPGESGESTLITDITNFDTSSDRPLLQSRIVERQNTNSFWRFLGRKESAYQLDNQTTISLDDIKNKSLKTYVEYMTSTSNKRGESFFRDNEEFGETIQRLINKTYPEGIDIGDKTIIKTSEDLLNEFPQLSYEMKTEVSKMVLQATKFDKTFGYSINSMKDLLFNKSTYETLTPLEKRVFVNLVQEPSYIGIKHFSIIDDYINGKLDHYKMRIDVIHTNLPIEELQKILQGQQQLTTLAN